MNCTKLAWAVLVAWTVGCTAQADDAEPPQFRAVLVSHTMVGTKRLEEFRAAGYNAVVLELADKVKTQEAAGSIRNAGFDLYYWIEIARNEAMADAHPDWMCSLQGHEDWRRLFKTSTNPKKGEVVDDQDKKRWRKDECGAWIGRREYADHQMQYGWEIDYISPGGGDELSNLRPLQWENYVDKSDGSLKCNVTASDKENVRR